MFAPKTKIPSFGAALPFPSTIITNYCFSAILKKCWPRQQNCRVLAPLYHFQIQLTQTIAFLHFKKKCLNLSSSPTAINTSQFDNCQSFCCHVCLENKISDFWRRSTLSKYNYYNLLLFCNFKKFEAKQFFFSDQYLTV